MKQAAQQFLRALRGKRSQQAFARRLGYRGNPITNWEHGRRYPTAAEALRAAARVKVDVPAAFARFIPAIPLTQERGAFLVGPWLRALAQTSTIATLARRSGFSRFSLARWFSGERSPKLPEFLSLVDVITGRVPDLIAELVPIESVPVLESRHRIAQAARRIAFEEPWAEAVQRVLETESTHAGTQAIAARLGISVRDAERVLALLETAALVRREGSRYVPLPPSTVDMRAAPALLTKLKQHWASVAAARAGDPREGDLFAYNVISVSAADLVRVRELLQSAFREMRSLVAASEPTECAALINVQLVGWNAAPPVAHGAASDARSARATTKRVPLPSLPRA